MHNARLDLMAARRGHDDDVVAFYLELWLQSLIRDHGPQYPEEDPYEEHGGEG